MKQPNLRLLLTADAVGGVWQYSVDLARGLSKLGVEVVLAILGPSPSEAQLKMAGSIEALTLVDTGLPLDWLARTRASVRKAGEAVAKLAKSHNVDLVQLNSPALAAEAEFPVPVVAVNHSCLATWWGSVKGERVDGAFKWRSDLGGEGLRRAARVVTPTAAFSEATKKAHDLPVLPTTVHNGRTPLALPRVAPHDFAFTAGRLWDKGKNAATLDRAAADLPVPLYMAGPLEGPNGDSTRLDHARALGNLGEKELARWLAAKPVFVSAALYEPFGLAVLEAAAAGCPLVLSDIPTFRELWDGVATFVDPMDPMAYARAVEAIVGDDYLRTAMGTAAKERAGRYTPEAMAREMLAIYRELAAPAKQGRVAA
ncbi:MAG TPA: glycosyltransferase family 4 protein [Allosphingosinicella sp.]